MRVGIGYDVHRLVAGRNLIIGGVRIPFDKGLSGHSDADVLCHAIGDALLGAAALGDLGRHFPSNDTKFKDISSLNLLDQIQKLLFQSGYRIINIDSSIIAEKPRMRPFIARMREIISASLKIEMNQVSIKATTSDGLGFIGLGDGIAAYAVSLIEQK